MSNIISLSLPPSAEKQLSTIQKEYGFSGRSETIRAAIRMLAAENKDLAKVSGTIDAAIIVVHDEQDTQGITQLLHQYQVLVKTQLHQHLSEHKCAEIFLVRGDAKNVEKLIKNLRKESAELVQLIVL